jgi:hypothetical protein
MKAGIDISFIAEHNGPGLILPILPVVFVLYCKRGICTGTTIRMPFPPVNVTGRSLFEGMGRTNKTGPDLYV